MELEDKNSIATEKLERFLAVVTKPCYYLVYLLFEPVFLKQACITGPSFIQAANDELEDSNQEDEIIYYYILYFIYYYYIFLYIISGVDGYMMG